MILEGDLRGGERLTQEDLANRLGISTTPAREGLLMLSLEGLIEASSGRGFHVVESTRKDVEDVYLAHGMLAGELTARACAAKDPELIALLRDLHNGMIAAYRSGDMATMESLNWSFHSSINRAANSPRLLLLLRTTLRFVPEHFYALVPDWPQASERRHLAIVEAFEAGDPEAARTAARSHVQAAGELLMAYFSDSGYWTRPGADTP